MMRSRHTHTCRALWTPRRLETSGTTSGSTSTLPAMSGRCRCGLLGANTLAAGEPGLAGSKGGSLTGGRQCARGQAWICHTAHLLLPHTPHPHCTLTCRIGLAVWPHACMQAELCAKGVMGELIALARAREPEAFEALRLLCYRNRIVVQQLVNMGSLELIEQVGPTCMHACAQQMQACACTRRVQA